MQQQVVWLVVGVIVLGLTVAVGVGLSYKWQKPKPVTVLNEFDLRQLSPGPDFEFDLWMFPEGEELEPFARRLTIVDAKIAFSSYVKVTLGVFDGLEMLPYLQGIRKSNPSLFAEIAGTKKFHNLHDFVKHVALFDTGLLSQLAARQVAEGEEKWKLDGDDPHWWDSL